MKAKVTHLNIFQKPRTIYWDLDRGACPNRSVGSDQLKDQYEHWSVIGMKYKIL